MSKELATILSSPTFYDQVDEITTLSDQIVAIFRDEYEAAHEDRRKRYPQAIEEVRETLILPE